MIAAIENAILARAKAAADAGLLGYHWKLLETYPAKWDDLFNAKVEFRAPALWVGFTGLDAFIETGAGDVLTDAHFGVCVGAQNLRNETATRHGGASVAEPGSYQLMLDVIGLVVGQSLGLDIGRIKPVEESLVDLVGTELGKRNVSMRALHVKTQINIAALAVDDGDLAPFETFHANWDVPPFGSVDADPDAPGVQLPDDAHADATDQVALPQ